MFMPRRRVMGRGQTAFRWYVRCHARELLRALEGVIDPELGRSVIELDMVRRAELVGGTAEVTIALTVAGCPLRASFQDQVDRALLRLTVSSALRSPLTS